MTQHYGHVSAPGILTRSGIHSFVEPLPFRRDTIEVDGRIIDFREPISPAGTQAPGVAGGRTDEPVVPAGEDLTPSTKQNTPTHKEATMSQPMFNKASKSKSLLRIAFAGPSGAGKTHAALLFAQTIGTRVAVIDTERGSASLYSDEPGLGPFDVLELESFHPQRYIEAIEAAVAAGYDCIVCDSLSHAWAGKDGALEQVDKVAKRTSSGNSYGAWREVTPLHNRLVETILQAKAHMICTLRSKQEYVQEKDERGKTVIRKIGLQPIFRDGVEYEFTVAADIDLEHNLIPTKTRCPAMSGQVYGPGEHRKAAETLRSWLASGKDRPATQHPAIAAAEAAGFTVMDEEPDPEIVAELIEIAAQLGKPASAEAIVADIERKRGDTPLQEALTARLVKARSALSKANKSPTTT